MSNEAPPMLMSVEKGMTDGTWIISAGGSSDGEKFKAPRSCDSMEDENGEVSGVTQSI